VLLVASLDVVVWKPYPADVPADQRTLCDVTGCRRPGDMLRIDPSHASYLMPKTGETHVFCQEHAGPAGLDEWLASAEPERQSVIDRFVLRLSGRRDLIHRSGDTPHT
jgi:hypothetical protein